MDINQQLDQNAADFRSLPEEVISLPAAVPIPISGSREAQPNNIKQWKVLWLVLGVLVVGALIYLLGGGETARPAATPAPAAGKTFAPTQNSGAPLRMVNGHYPEPGDALTHP